MSFWKVTLLQPGEREWFSIESTRRAAMCDVRDLIQQGFLRVTPTDWRNPNTNNVNCVMIEKLETYYQGA